MRAECMCGEPGVVLIQSETGKTMWLCNRHVRTSLELPLSEKSKRAIRESWERTKQ